MKLSHFIISILLIPIVSCENQNDISNTEYEVPSIFNDFEKEQDLQLYFEQTFNNKPSDTVFFIPLNSCEKCVDKTIDILASSRFGGQIILGGNPTKYILSDSSILSMKNVLIDTTNEFYSYDIGITTPTVIVLNGQNSKISNFGYTTLDSVLNEFHWENNYVK